MPLGGEQMQEIYERTVVVRRPTYGIVKAYHNLPYVCLGESIGDGGKTTQVKGKISVSPRFLIRPQHLEPSYEEIFGEENVDLELSGRIFGFLGFRGRPVECKSEHLELAHLDVSIDDLLSDTISELERMEDITTGVLITPDARYYPVSLERFISSVLDDEFRD